MFCVFVSVFIFFLSCLVNAFAVKKEHINRAVVLRYVKGVFITKFYKIIRIVYANSHWSIAVFRWEYSHVCKHDYDITLILIGYVLLDINFDWLVGNLSVYQENLFQSRSKKTAFSFIILSNYFLEIFSKSNRGLSSVCTYPHLNTRDNWVILDSYANPQRTQLPLSLDEAMHKHGKSPLLLWQQKSLNNFLINAPTCCPLFPLPTSPVFKGEVVDAAAPLIPGVDAVGVVAVLPSEGRKPVADIGTTSKNCFWQKRQWLDTCNYPSSIRDPQGAHVFSFKIIEKIPITLQFRTLLGTSRWFWRIL